MAADTEVETVYCLPLGQVPDDVAAGGAAVHEPSLMDSDVGAELVRLTVPAAVVAEFGHMEMAVEEGSQAWSME